MYDLMEVKSYQPRGNYTIDSSSHIDCRKEQLVAALAAEDTAQRRKTEARWCSIFRSLANLFGLAPKTISERSFVSQ